MRMRHFLFGLAAVLLSQICAAAQEGRAPARNRSGLHIAHQPVLYNGSPFPDAEMDKQHRIRRGADAVDIGRAGTEVTGGITSVMKSIHLYESFGMSIELHGNTIGNLHCLGAMGIDGKYFERGLLHPMLDYEKPKPWFRKIYDPMDKDGYVKIPDGPGLGLDFDFDYINDNLV